MNPIKRAHMAVSITPLAREEQMDKLKRSMINSDSATSKVYWLVRGALDVSNFNPDADDHMDVWIEIWPPNFERFRQ